MQSWQRKFGEELLIALVLAVLCMAFWGCGQSKGAPAPIYPPVTLSEATLTGDWVISWSGEPHPCSLLPGGRWYCWYGRYGACTHYRGRWTLRGEVLTVREWTERERSGTTWTMRLRVVRSERGRIVELEAVDRDAMLRRKRR